MLQALKKWSLAHEPHLLHIHSSEELIATLLFRKRYSQTPVEYFESIGLLDGDTFLAHQVQCTQHDFEILERTHTKVVNNPLANTILSSGMMNYSEFMKRGIPFAVSTDGSGSADNQNILAALKLALQWMIRSGLRPTGF